MTAEEADKAAEWRGMSPMTAFTLIIDGMARDFDDVAVLMDAWRRANPVIAEPATACQRKWFGVGYLEQTGYIDKQDGHGCERN